MESYKYLNRAFPWSKKQGDLSSENVLEQKFAAFSAKEEELGGYVTIERKTLRKKKSLAPMKSAPLFWTKKVYRLKFYNLQLGVRSCG